MVVLGACSNPAPKDDPSYFTIRPVVRQFEPPCAAPAIVEMRDRKAFRCFELGPPGVDASDVKSASLVKQPATKTDAVEFELTANGAERFNLLARTVGVGGQAAIVVDGAVVSAPRLDVTEFAGKGVVTGLSTEDAPRLAKRLNRG